MVPDTKPIAPEVPLTTEMSKPAAAFRADIIPGVLFAVALVFFSVRLAEPPRYIFDEVYHAYTAGQYVAGNSDAYLWDTSAPDPNVAYMWNHPPAGVLMIAGGIRLWGNTPFGWRFASAVFGAIGVVMAYLLALRITRRKGVAVLTSGLLLVDGLYFVQSRTGMLDIFGTVFMMGALLALYGYLTSPPDRVRGPLLAIGVFLGLALATKWNAAYASALVGIVTLVRAFNLWRAGRSEHAKPEVRDGLRVHLVWIPVALMAVPLAVYLMAYVSFFAAGHGPGQFIELQNQIFRYHTGLTATHTYQSRWWEWPLTLRPVWYHSAHVDGKLLNIYANGNPMLYWAFVPAVLWVVASWCRRREPAWIVLAIGFFGQWLPWALVPRIAFAYHFLPAAMFGSIAVAFVLAALFERGGWRRTLAVAYLIVVVLAFVYFYPVYAGTPLTEQALDNRMWISSWR